MNGLPLNPEDQPLGGASFARRLADEVLRRLDEELLAHPPLLRRLRLDLVRSPGPASDPGSWTYTGHDMECMDRKTDANRSPEDSIGHPDSGPEWIHASEDEGWTAARWSGTVRQQFPSIRSFLNRLPTSASRRAVVLRSESNGFQWVHVFYPTDCSGELSARQPHWECVSLQDYSVMGNPARLGRMLGGLKNPETAKVIEERTTEHFYVHVFFEVAQ